MRTNHDGTYLDGDRRPRPASYAVPVFEPEPVDAWKVLPRRTKLALFSHYVSVPVSVAAAAAAMWAGQVHGVAWLLLSGMVLAGAAGCQIGLLIIVRAEPDAVIRRTAFAAANAMVILVADAALLGVIGASWRLDPEDALLGWLALILFWFVLIDGWKLRGWLPQLRGWRLRLRR